MNMKEKYYFIKTNGYDMVVVDDGEMRYFHILDDTYPDPIAFLAGVEDFSSWDCSEEPVSKFTDSFDNLVVAEYTRYV